MKLAREISVDSGELSNKNVVVRIGAPENRNAPKTIYTSISFWIKEKQENIENSRKKLEKYIDDSIKKVLLEKNINTHLLPLINKSYIIKNIPENIFYNNKKNYINIELYVHTCNVNSNKKELSKKKDKDLYFELLKITNKIIEDDFFLSNKEFEIYKKMR